ncbi:hypothetical protein EDD11_008712 [Mortierella claussenii]|nr:hypothetical protein EDD11_008712 [Mortierella claussenii]
MPPNLQHVSDLMDEDLLLVDTSSTLSDYVLQREPAEPQPTLVQHEQHVLNRLDKIQQTLETCVSRLCLSSEPNGSLNILSNAGQETEEANENRVLARIAAIERTVEAIAHPSLPLSRDVDDAAVAQSTEQDDSQQRTSDDEDIDSPERMQLLARIDIFKNLLFNLERSQLKEGTHPPPPEGLDIEDEDIFITWCFASMNTPWYKKKLMTRLEELRKKEVKEIKWVGNSKRRICKDGDSPYRRQLRAKIDAVKLAAINFYPMIGRHMMRPALPTDLSSIDLDVFLTWCLRSPDYKGYKRIDGYDLNGKAPGDNTYEQELGYLLRHLRAKEAEEKQYLKKLIDEADKQEQHED